MSKKCRAYSESKLGLEPPDNRKAFYAGWDAALADPVQEPVQDGKCKYCVDGCPACDARKLPVQEPVAWWNGKESVVFTHDEIYTPNWTDYWTQPLYASPPQRKPLTLQEVDAIWATKTDIESVVRAVEKAHGIEGES